ncbi:MAG TPA: hypothetical protein VKE51_14845 [Vicinamibacterales bacterium]|nr:hypothetical protein [Vicinamibacterales bacterium]
MANVLPPDDPGPQSLGQQVQNAFPQTRVVKTLNTVNSEVMVNPQLGSAARATESYMPLWLALWRTLGTAAFSIKVVRQG